MPGMRFAASPAFAPGHPIVRSLSPLALVALVAAPAIAAPGERSPAKRPTDDARPLVENASTVRVRLLRLTRPRTFTLVADAPMTVRGGAGGPVLARLAAGSSVGVSVQGGLVTMEGAGERWQAPTLLAEADVFTIALPTTGRDSRRRYSGTLRLDDDAASAGTLRLIHTTDMESYVAAVVQREYGLGDLEGAKAMAVAARTYALRSRGRFGREFDLVDDIQSQVFFGLQNVTELSKRAARETRGEVLTFRGSLAEAVYSASSGGHTASNETIWGTAPVAYLRARPDPYDTAVSPHARWTTRVPRTALLAALAARLNVPVVGIRLSGMGTDGRATGVHALLENGRQMLLSMSRFRSLVNGTYGTMSLRSSRFTTRLDGEEMVFDGSGFGHGVGLSQWGAHGQAEAGRSYRDILSFYYAGTSIRSADGVTLPLAPLPSVVRPEEAEAAMFDRAFAHLRSPTTPPPASPTPSASGPATRPASRPAATPATRPTPRPTAAPDRPVVADATAAPRPPMPSPAPERPATDAPAARRATVERPRPADAAASPAPTTAPGWTTPTQPVSRPTPRTGW